MRHRAGLLWCRVVGDVHVGEGEGEGREEGGRVMVREGDEGAIHTSHTSFTHIPHVTQMPTCLGLEGHDHLHGLHLHVGLPRLDLRAVLLKVPVVVVVVSSRGGKEGVRG